MTVYVVTSCEGSYEETYYCEYYNTELEAKIRCYHLNKEDKIVWETYDFTTIYDMFCPKWGVRKLEAGPPQTTAKGKAILRNLKELE